MNSNKFRFYLLAFFLICSTSYSQETSSYKNAVVFDLGGNGLAYSINYERSLSSKINARAGFSFWRINENQTAKSLIVMSYPISFNYMINLSDERHFIETGLGIMNLLTSGDLVEYKGITNYYLNPFLNLGYRYKPAKNRFVYRAGLSPFLGTKSLTNPTEQGFQPLGSKIQIWGYIGIGYQF